MKIIKQKFLINLIENLLLRGTEYQSGTYNRMDPTAYSHSKIEYHNLVIYLKDCTWGIDIQVKTKSRKTLAEIYYSIDGKDSCLIPRDTWNHKWFKLFKEIVKNVPEVVKEYCEEGCPDYWA